MQKQYTNFYEEEESDQFSGDEEDEGEEADDGDIKMGTSLSPSKKAKLKEKKDGSSKSEAKRLFKLKPKPPKRNMSVTKFTICTRRSDEYSKKAKDKPKKRLTRLETVKQLFTTFLDRMGKFNSLLQRPKILILLPFTKEHMTLPSTSASPPLPPKSTR